MTDPALHAWIDESMRAPTKDLPGSYILAGVSCDEMRATGIRDGLRAMRLPRQDRIHWRDENEARRDQLVDHIVATAIPAVVVVGTPMLRAKQERARRICMEMLLPMLAQAGVTKVWFESRTPPLNRADSQMVTALRGKRLLSPNLRVDFALPSHEAMLWLSDVLAGVVNSAQGGSLESRKRMTRIEPSVHIADTRLR